MKIELDDRLARLLVGRLVRIRQHIAMSRFERIGLLDFTGEDSDGAATGFKITGSREEIIATLEAEANLMRSEQAPMSAKRRNQFDASPALVALLKHGVDPGDALFDEALAMAASRNIQQDGTMKHSADEDPRSEGDGFDDRREIWTETERISVINALRATADRPRPDDVASILLLAKAISNSGRSLDDVLNLLRCGRPIVLFVSPVDGVPERIRMMIGAGLILKGEHEVKDSRDVHVGRASWQSTWKPKRLIAFTCPNLGPDVTRPPVLRDQIASVMSAVEPIIVLADRIRAIPDRLRDVSHLVLDTGPLDPEIVAQTITICLGRRPTETIDAALCARLDMTDLLIAIRPGATFDGAVQALRRYADEQNDQGDHDPEARSSLGSGQTAARSRSTDIDAVVLHPDLSPQAPRIDAAAGYGKAIDWAKDLQLDLADFKAGAIEWTDLSAKILLAGPPGTGKTMFARMLGNSLCVPVLMSSPAHWLEPSHLGDVLKRMKAVFAAARRLAPSILFIDEVDGLGSRKNGGDQHYSSYHRNVVDQALILLDGLAATQGVIVVAATNRPEDLDPALVRSGRLEKRIDIDLPDEAALTEIIRHHVGDDLFATEGNLCRPSDIDKTMTGTRDCSSAPPRTRPIPTHLEGTSLSEEPILEKHTHDHQNLFGRLSRAAFGLSGADIERLVRTARRIARRQGRPLEATDLIEVFSERHQNISPELRWRVAVHEAGHVLVHRALGYGEPLSVHVDDSGGRMVANLSNRVQTERELMNHVTLLLAGQAAEEIVFGIVSAGAGMSEVSDLAKATDLASRIETQSGLMSPLYTRGDAIQQRLLTEMDLRGKVLLRLQEANDEAKKILRPLARDIERVATSLTTRLG